MTVKWIKNALLILGGIFIIGQPAWADQIKRIVVFKDGGRGADQKAILDQAFRDLATKGGSSGYQISSTFSFMNGVCIAIDQSRGNRAAVNRALDALKDDPHIKLVDHNHRYHLIDGEDAEDGKESPPADKIPEGIKQHNFPKAWAAGLTGKGVRVGIADTGLCGMHPDIAKNVKGGKDCTEDAIGWDNKSNHWHGQHVAGTIAANGGIKGGAPDAELYIGKCLGTDGSGSFEGIANAVQYLIDQKCQVINMSLGSAGHFAEADEMIAGCIKNNVLPICAAGNDGGEVGSPANSKGSHAVAAIDSKNKTASFSSHGPEVRSSANGVDVLSCGPNGSYKKSSGTSMATPHVCAAAALYLQKNHNLKPSALSDLLAKKGMNVGLPSDFGTSVNAAGILGRPTVCVRSTLRAMRAARAAVR